MLRNLGRPSNADKFTNARAAKSAARTPLAKLNFSIRRLSDFVEVVALAVDRYDSWEILDRKSRDRLGAKLWIG